VPSVSGIVHRLHRHPRREPIGSGAVERALPLENDAGVPLAEDVFESRTGAAHREDHAAVSCGNRGAPTQRTRIRQRARRDFRGQFSSIGEEDPFTHGGRVNRLHAPTLLSQELREEAWLQRAGLGHRIGHLEDLSEHETGDGVTGIARVESPDGCEDADAQ